MTALEIDPEYSEACRAVAWAATQVLDAPTAAMIAADYARGRAEAMFLAPNQPEMHDIDPAHRERQFLEWWRTATRGCAK